MGLGWGNGEARDTPAPHLISFAPDCFEVVGTVPEYRVVMSAPNYPRVFSDRDAAEAFAKKTGRRVTVSTRTIQRRIKWF